MSENTPLASSESSSPRFEFRTFGQDFARAAVRMARLSMPVPESVWERRSEEIYILSRTNDVNNTKIRGGKMDIKTLVQVRGVLEQWNPLMKGEFPMARECFEAEVFPAFGVPMPKVSQDNLTLDQFLDMIRAHPDLQAVRIRKQRFGYQVQGTLCEVANVLINGAQVVTLSSESTVEADVLATIELIGLGGIENINYLQAIKRVIGMIDKPLAN